MTLICACNNNGVVTKGKKISEKQLEEDLIYANKRAVVAEMNRINDYILRYNYDMNVTGTGLHYTIYEKGGGSKSKTGNIIEMDYTLKFLWGDTAYTSQTSGPIVFEIGHGHVESGLEELALLLSEGDKVNAIIPSHLGYGLMGDGDRIPAKATLVYDIHVVAIKNK